MQNTKEIIYIWKNHYNIARPHSSLRNKQFALSATLIHSSQINQVGLTLGVVQIVGACHKLLLYNFYRVGKSLLLRVPFSPNSSDDIFTVCAVTD